MGQYVFFYWFISFWILIYIWFWFWNSHFGPQVICLFVHLCHSIWSIMLSLSVFGFVRLNVLVLLLLHLLTLNDILLHLTIINEVSTRSFCLQCTFFSSGFFSCYGFHIDREDNAYISFLSLAAQFDPSLHLLTRVFAHLFSTWHDLKMRIQRYKLSAQSVNIHKCILHLKLEREVRTE